MIGDKAQGYLLNKIKLYLKQSGRNKSIISDFGGEGYCAGLASLWLYSKHLQTQPKNYRSALKAIATWAGQNKLDEKDKEKLK